jgi:hypothetical protein
MHKVIQDKVRALNDDKLFFLPSYLAQLYAYAECKLEIEIDDKDIINELYGTEDEDVLTDEEPPFLKSPKVNKVIWTV